MTKQQVLLATVAFNKERVTKKDWEDATCDDCGRGFWPVEKTAYVHEHKNLHWQLCETCVMA